MVHPNFKHIQCPWVKLGPARGCLSFCNVYIAYHFVTTILMLSMAANFIQIHSFCQFFSIFVRRENIMNKLPDDGDPWAHNNLLIPEPKKTTN